MASGFQSMGQEVSPYSDVSYGDGSGQFDSINVSDGASFYCAAVEGGTGNHDADDEMPTIISR